MPQDTSASVGEGERVRVLTDADGRRWVVRERPAAPYDRRMGVTLVFSGDDVMRRVRNFPADWYTLSDQALYTLSLGA
jgi:hypothetical protein